MVLSSGSIFILKKLTRIIDCISLFEKTSTCAKEMYIFFVDVFLWIRYNC